ncbi:hypothetical protein O181_020541 [Austropuccinia psidii MF-1]|uniref:Uncharacterized protein n=1 Tax=Austropuccinia psidii MF-1 TaxID=1389203 RepID=A0A9Q3C988_9BASI|nr:hypothetical protein [Austropuccinia psidii MF-1]
MCQHCSSQTSSSTESDRQGVALRTLQYNQHIKELKLPIECKYISNIPTSESGSEFPQMFLDNVFANDYYLLTQSTFSTLLGLNSTVQKPYSWIQNPPPQEPGIIMSSILCSRYKIPDRAPHNLKLFLNLLNK